MTRRPADFQLVSAEMKAETEPLHTLLFERSPLGELDAIVQHDSRVVYLFLSDPQETIDTRACWVRNLIPGPMTFVQTDLDRGVPPVLPSIFCNHAQGAPLPDAESLRVIWFEEGNAIALLEGQRLLAVIPPWSGQDQFHGYAADCTAENTVCWPMPDRPALWQRIDQADAFWRQIELESIRASQLASWQKGIADRFGPSLEMHAFRWRGRFHIQSHRYCDAGGDVWVTTGLSLFAQPNVELSLPRPASQRRIELGIRRVDWDASTDAETLLAVLRHVAGIPWRTWRWIGAQHVCQFLLMTPDRRSIPFEVELSADESMAGTASPAIVRSDPVNLLWIRPRSPS